MAYQEISRNAEIYGNGTTGTSANLNGDVLDLLNAESVLGIGITAATNASSWLKWQEGTASGTVTDTTGYVAGTKTTLYLEVARPKLRYGRFVFKAASTTGAYRTLTTIKHSLKVLPATQPASTTGTRLYSPNTGTATG